MNGAEPKPCTNQLNLFKTDAGGQVLIWNLGLTEFLFILRQENPGIYLPMLPAKNIGRAQEMSAVPAGLQMIY